MNVSRRSLTWWAASTNAWGSRLMDLKLSILNFIFFMTSKSVCWWNWEIFGWSLVSLPLLLASMRWMLNFLDLLDWEINKTQSFWSKWRICSKHMILSSDWSMAIAKNSSWVPNWSNLSIFWSLKVNKKKIKIKWVTWFWFSPSREEQSNIYSWFCRSTKIFCPKMKRNSINLWE